MADISLNITFAETHLQFLKDAVDSDPEMSEYSEEDYQEKARIKIESLINKYLKERYDDIQIQILNSQFSQDKQNVKDTDLPVDMISVT